MTKSGQDVIYEGWLIKSPPMNRVWRARWRRRWFSLQYSGELPGQVLLMYYTDRNQRKLKGIIDMDRCVQVDTGLKFDHKKYNFDHMFDITTPNRTYYLAADNEEEMLAWVTCICKSCGLKVISNDDDSAISRVLPPSLYGITYDKKPDNLRGDSSDSPPVTPVSSGPYIPISECITGRSPTQGVKDFRTLVDLNTKNSFCRPPTRDVSNNTYDSNPHIYLNESETDPKFYDFPRSLGRPTAAQRKQKPTELYANLRGDKNLSPLQSPTDSENVFTDEDWPLSASSTDTTPKVPKISTTEEGIKKITLEGYRTLDPPPRPPKSVRVACFNSLQRECKASKETVGTMQKNEEDVQAKGPSDEMYDFPRSHQLDSAEIVPQRHCYTNAAPGKVEGEIFRYDISPKAHSTNTHVFQFDISDEEKQHSPLAFSQPNSSPLFQVQLKSPPEVNRRLKPKRKLSDSLSISSSTEPSSPRLAPCVDRSRKPALSGKGTMQKTYDSELDYMRRFRTVPSPILDNPYGNHKICSLYDDGIKRMDHDDYKKIQYLDLDLGDSSFSASVKSEPLRSPGAMTVYKHVDFVKTEAFNITRHNLEKERKEPVTTYKK